MDLTPHVERLRHELGVAAAAGGDDAVALAERLTAPLESAVRLTLLEALAEAADEITRELAPGSVEMRLRGRDPGFAVTPAPTENEGPGRGGPERGGPERGGPGRGGPGRGGPGRGGPGLDGTAPPGVAAAPEAPFEVEDGAMTRINLRLPDTLKARVEEAASREHLSVNAWLVRSATAALTPDDRTDRVGPTPRHSARGGQSLTGWVR